MDVLAVVVAYLIGSISTSTIVTRIIAKTDIRNHGSGNAGATNTLRVLGAKWAILVLIVDALKGVLASLLAMHLAPGHTVTVYVAALAVIAGHNWPIFFRFRGGKGAATTIGVFLTVHLLVVPALVAGGIGIALLVLTRYVSLAALCFVVLMPVLCTIFGRPLLSILFVFVVAAFSVYRHRSNIVRLVQGKEHRLFSKS